MASAVRRSRTEFKIVVDDKGKLIGEGTFGVVYPGWWLGVPAAIKRIELVKLKNNNHEEDALRRLNHPNVLSLFDVDQDDNFKYFALELCAATVDDYCENKYNGPLPSENESLYQMASGLHYIHQQQFIHRDIKPENILISFPSRSDSSVQLKISDFGFCKPVSVRGTMSLSGIRGTFRWLAPELLPFLGIECLSERGNISSDVFSLGCVFGYFLTRGVHPFGREVFLVMARISEGNSDLSTLNHVPTYQMIVSGMIHNEPTQRTRLEEVCAALQPPTTPITTDRPMISPVRRMFSPN